MAQRGVNKAIILGRVGQDPQINNLPSGGMVANLSVATSEARVDKNSGQKQEKTDWHKVCVFGKLAEIVSQYVTKGSLVYFEGKNCTRKYQDQSGQDRYITEIVVDGFSGVMQMLDSRQDGQQNQTPQQNYQQPAQQAPAQHYQQQPQPGPQQTAQQQRQPVPGMNANGTQQSPMSGLPNNHQQPMQQQSAPPGSDPFNDSIPFAQHMKHTFI